MGRRFRARWMGLLAGLLMLAGCIHVPLPLPEGDAIYGRHVFDEADLAFFKEGAVTREEVLFRFGEPDLASRDERVIGYVWENFAGVYVVLMFPYIPIAGGSYPRTHLVMMEFDEGGRLMRWDSEEFSIWTSSILQHVEEWIPGWGEANRRQRPAEVISLWPVKLAPAGSCGPPLRVKVEPVLDDRAQRGESGRMLGSNLGYGYDVVSRQTVAFVLTKALEGQLRMAGHAVVDSGADIILRGTIAYFQFSQGDVNVGAWEPAKSTTLAAADVRIEARDAHQPERTLEFSLSGRSRRETTYPQDPPYEELAKDCIAQLLAQFAEGFSQVETGGDFAGKETPTTMADP